MALTAGLIDWGVALRPLAGESESGDRHVLAEVPNGELVAVMDGLGHGPIASQAATIAAATVEAYAHEPPAFLFQRCHERLKRTRGVVMSVAAFDPDGTLTWLGVGNVVGVLARAQAGTSARRDWLLVRGGVVGDRLPTLRHSILRVRQGDTLYMATDGISDDFTRDIGSRDPPQRIADDILRRYARATDDALILVARYLPDAQ